MRVLEDAGAIGHRAGERAARVAEQLGLDEIVGQRRAVERAERAVAAPAAAVNRPRHQLLAAAALPFDEDRERRRRGALDRAPQIGHRRRDAQEIGSGRRTSLRAPDQQRRHDRRGGGRRHRQQAGRAGEIVGAADRPPHAQRADRAAAVHHGGGCLEALLHAMRRNRQAGLDRTLGDRQVDARSVVSDRLGPSVAGGDERDCRRVQLLADQPADLREQRQLVVGVLADAQDRQRLFDESIGGRRGVGRLHRRAREERQRPQSRQRRLLFDGRGVVRTLEHDLQHVPTRSDERRRGHRQTTQRREDARIAHAVAAALDVDLHQTGRQHSQGSSSGPGGFEACGHMTLGAVEVSHRRTDECVRVLDVDQQSRVAMRVCSLARLGQGGHRVGRGAVGDACARQEPQPAHRRRRGRQLAHIAARQRGRFAVLGSPEQTAREPGGNERRTPAVPCRPRRHQRTAKRALGGVEAREIGPRLRARNADIEQQRRVAAPHRMLTGIVEHAQRVARTAALQDRRRQPHASPRRILPGVAAREPADGLAQHAESGRMTSGCEHRSTSLDLTTQPRQLAGRRPGAGDDRRRLQVVGRRDVGIEDAVRRGLFRHPRQTDDGARTAIGERCRPQRAHERSGQAERALGLAAQPTECGDGRRRGTDGVGQRVGTDSCQRHGVDTAQLLRADEHAHVWPRAAQHRIEPRLQEPLDAALDDEQAAIVEELPMGLQQPRIDRHEAMHACRSREHEDRGVEPRSARSPQHRGARPALVYRHEHLGERGDGRSLHDRDAGRQVGGRRRRFSDRVNRIASRRGQHADRAGLAVHDLKRRFVA